MIPHRIFYIWFGSELPTSVQMCLRNWQHVLPSDWEFIRIGEESSPWFDLQSELKQCKWLRTVYERGMWAFVSDYARCKVLHTHGGVYLDTDITLERDLSPLLDTPLFLGWESPQLVNMSICGSTAGHGLLAHMLNFYQKEIWHSPLYTIPSILTHLLRTHFDASLSYTSAPQYLPSITLYPCEYFYPWAYGSAYSSSCITPHTYTIHWWSESWINPDFEYFLFNKHIPGFDFKRLVTRRITTLYRMGPLRIIVIKEQQNCRRYYFLGFIPYLSVTSKKARFFGFIPLTVKRKEKNVCIEK